MLRKFYIILCCAFFVSMLPAEKLTAQVKKTASQKTTAVKKTTTLKKATPAKNTSMVKKTVPVTPLVYDSPAGSVRVKISTDSGVIIVKLYDSTPLHRDNFVKLVNEGFYDSLMFHRVIPGFMIQGGDPFSKNAVAGAMLGNGGSDMARIPAEFRPSLIHKRGALAAARDGNPEKASSACQFYLVEGNLVSDEQLNAYEQGRGVKYTAEQRSMYKTLGGTPMLDQNYTVFGEVESGLEVIHKIATMQRDNANRPLGDIRMHMELLK